MNSQITTEKTIQAETKLQFYSDKAVKLLLLALLLIAAGLILVVIMLMLFKVQNPSPVYFKASERSELIEEVPLDKPNMPSNALLNWVTEIMMTVNTFNFVNVTKVTEEAKEHFTVEGYQSYLLALKNAKVFDEVLNNKYVLRAQPTSSPQITKEGVLADHYLWKIKVVMRFDLRNVDSANTEDADITLLVMRVPTKQSPQGVKILKYDIVLKRPE